LYTCAVGKHQTRAPKPNSGKGGGRKGGVKGERNYGKTIKIRIGIWGKGGTREGFSNLRTHMDLVGEILSGKRNLGRGSFSRRG